MSLWGSDSSTSSSSDRSPSPSPAPPLLASLTPPPIPGLYIFRSSIPLPLQQSLSLSLSSSSIFPSSSDQVMLFTSPLQPLPTFLSPLLSHLSTLLIPPVLPLQLSQLILESTLARQTILNLYRPGKGITEHIDLPERYEDGIVGISLCGSTSLEFSRVVDGSEEEVRHAMLLRPGDVYVLSGEARWDWKHGIPYREYDWVEDEDGGEGEGMWLKRRLRMSITLRRMKEGAHVVGGVDKLPTTKSDRDVDGAS